MTAERTQTTTATGTGQAFGHHGEIIQGVFEVEDARLRRGLLSLPCRHLQSTATFRPNQRTEISVSPSDRRKAKQAAQLTIERFAKCNTGGHLDIETNIPVGCGMGSSTADVLASILAVLDYLGVDAPPEQIMRIAIEAEIACDSTLFHQNAVLFAQRDGVVIEPFQKRLPPIHVVSVNTDPGSQVCTLGHGPARYESSEIEQFRPMRSLLRRAIKLSDSTLLGRVATASAQINQRFLPKQQFKKIETIARHNAAVGLQVAHSGTVVGLMFDAMDERAHDKMENAAAQLRRLDLDPVIYVH